MNTPDKLAAARARVAQLQKKIGSNAKTPASIDSNAEVAALRTRLVELENECTELKAELAKVKTAASKPSSEANTFLAGPETTAKEMASRYVSMMKSRTNFDDVSGIDASSANGSGMVEYASSQGRSDELLQQIGSLEAALKKSISENADLKQENELLKKKLSFFANNNSAQSEPVPSVQYRSMLTTEQPTLESPYDYDDLSSDTDSENTNHNHMGQQTNMFAPTIPVGATATSTTTGTATAAMQESEPLSSFADIDLYDDSAELQVDNARFPDLEINRKEQIHSEIVQRFHDYLPDLASMRITGGEGPILAV
ncbi:hypothetical protein CANCADRAFT_56151 [Tortispora caseinolytica NRRL Y-17796]|uniref:Uncharacterized protein n=1 Tax=Tortispora caseinolytica NRRL Y-17796 TaxID=767744 RepID=A0A1E4TLH8_9ASCO|nr:hypothetical protein CANCADRAFT_56151 [Tortispora caseinolytica NRRL Y-17796]